MSFDFEVATVFAAMLVSLVIGLLIGKRIERWWWRGEMVERGHAMYHYFDGKWYWLEDLPKGRDPAARKVETLGGYKGESHARIS